MIRVDIVKIDDRDDECVVESKDFDVRDRFDKSIDDWTYKKLLEYDDQYDFDNWEEMEDYFEFRYYDEQNKMIYNSSLLDDWMNL